MNKLTALPVAASIAAALCSMATVTVATERATAPVQVVGEKIDSGLGSLPHYSKWAVPVAGEKVDSGLGSLPHYSKWADPTGKNPLQADASTQRASVQLSQAN